MSWAYCAPKSTTRTVSCAGVTFDRIYAGAWPGGRPGAPTRRNLAVLARGRVGSSRGRVDGPRRGPAAHDGAPAAAVERRLRRPRDGPRAHRPAGGRLVPRAPQAVGAARARRAGADAARPDPRHRPEGDADAAR